jgi:hypothetical protein
MRITDITPKLTFYGTIPPGSEKEHLGIVLLNDEVDMQYCYCTSKEKVKRIFKNYYSLTSDVMRNYFPNNAKESYIVLSDNFIITLLCFTFITNVNRGEFDMKTPLGDTIFEELLQKILDADTVSGRIKEEIRKRFTM